MKKGKCNKGLSGTTLKPASSPPPHLHPHPQGGGGATSMENTGEHYKEKENVSQCVLRWRTKN